MLKNKVMISLGLLSLLGPATTFAAADGFLANSKFRVGAGAGNVKIEEEGGGVSISASSTGWEIFGGFEFNRYFAIEIGYLDAGAADDDFQGVIAEYDTSAAYASVIGSLPFNDHVSVYGRGGVLSWEAEQEVRFNGQVFPAGDADGSDPFFGIGFAATLDEALLRLEYRLAEIDEVDLSVLGLSVVWRF